MFSILFLLGCVMFVGLILMQGFVDSASRMRSFV